MVSGLSDGSINTLGTSSAPANVIDELDLSGLDFAAFEKVLFDVQQLGRARGGMSDDEEEGRKEPEDEGRRKSRIFSEEEERLGRLHDRPSGSGSGSNAQVRARLFLLLRSFNASSRAHRSVLFSSQMTLPQMMLSSTDNDTNPLSIYNPPSYSEPYHYPPPIDQLAFDMPTFLREIQEYSRSHFGVVMDEEVDGEDGVGGGGGDGGEGGW